MWEVKEVKYYGVDIVSNATCRRFRSFLCSLDSVAYKALNENSLRQHCGH